MRTVRVMGQRNRQPHRLDDTERAAWLGLLRAHSRLVRQLDAELQSSSGLPLSEFDVLAQLGRAGQGELRMSELADSVLLSPSGCTRLIERLEADGLVERRRSSSDSRVVIVRLTPAGKRRLSRSVPAHLRAVRSRFVDRLTRDEIELLATIWRRLEDDKRPA